MTSSTGTPEEVRPLTQEELAEHVLYDAVDGLRDVQRKIDTAWASLPDSLRSAHGPLTAATLARIGADALALDLDRLRRRRSGGPSDD